MSSSRFGSGARTTFTSRARSIRFLSTGRRVRRYLAWNYDQGRESRSPGTTPLCVRSIKSQGKPGAENTGARPLHEVDQDPQHGRHPPPSVTNRFARRAGKSIQSRSSLALGCSEARQIRVRGKRNLPRQFNPIWAVQTWLRKYFSFVFSETNDYSPRSAPT